LQPRGFGVPSRPFVEHQVVPALLLLASAGACAGLLARRPGGAGMCLGMLAGFALVALGVAFVDGNTFVANLCLVPFVLCITLVRHAVPFTTRRARWAGMAVGALLGGAFWLCAWAPEPSTRPAGGTAPSPRLTPFESARDGDLSVLRRGAAYLVRGPHGEVEVDLSLAFEAANESGIWTLFRWEPSRWEADVDVRWDGGEVRLVATLLLPHDVHAHLAHAVRIRTHGEASVAGVPWPTTHRGTGAATFVAYGPDGLALRRASRGEKGPFRTLAALPDADPWISVDGWDLRVEGWAAQCSREPSPTAGWGISQGVIEEVARGWNTVTTGAGVYRFEVVLRPR
jgi:hypothetical protein